MRALHLAALCVGLAACGNPEPPPGAASAPRGDREEAPVVSGRAETEPASVAPSSGPDRRRADTSARLDVRDLPSRIVAELDGVPLSGVVILEPGVYEIYLHVDGALVETRNMRLRLGDTVTIDPAPLLAEAATRRAQLERHRRIHPGCGVADDPYEAWLVAHRMSDGSWDAARFVERCSDEPRCDGAVDGVAAAETTALAVLTLIARGDTHQTGRYRVALREGLDWLSRRQTEGGLLAAGAVDETRVHALATLAFTELTAFADSPRHRRVAQPGVDHLLASRRMHGGWARTSGASADSPADAAATGWAVMAIESASRAGCSLPAEWRAAALRDLDGLGDPETMSDADAALVTLAHLVLGRAADHPRVVAGLAHVLTVRPDSRHPLRLFLASAAVFRWASDPAGRDAWKRWNEGLRGAGVAHFWGRDDDGALLPRYAPPVEPDLGRLHSLAWASLSQALYYRYGRVLGLTED